MSTHQRSTRPPPTSAARVDTPEQSRSDAFWSAFAASPDSRTRWTRSAAASWQKPADTIDGI